MPDILQTPWWITVVRGFQVLFSLIVFALAATIIHDVYLEELGLCIATGLITWIVTAYLIATEKSKAIQHLYHIIAVLCLEAFMVILWLATFAATAARRAGFVYNVSVADCYNDGSTINSSHCSYLKRRFLLRRGAVLFKTGQGLMSGAAGLGALVWLLYIVTFVWTVLMFTRGRKEGRFIMSSTSPSQDHQLEEAKTETVHLQQQQQQPPMNQHAQQQQQPPQQQYSPGHQTVAAQQHQYPPTPVTQPYAPSPDTHYTGMASTMSPSTPSEVASYNHQSELASHGSQSGQPVQMPTYDEHHYQADYAQHHSAELPAMQATYTPQTGQEYHAPQQ